MRGTRGNPLSEADILAKFRANVRDVLTTSQADQAIDSLLRLETAEDVAPVFDRLEGARALGGLPVSRLS